MARVPELISSSPDSRDRAGVFVIFRKANYGKLDLLLGLFLATAVLIGWFCISRSGRSEADQGPVEQGWLGVEGLQQVQAVVRCWGFQNMEIEVCLAGWAFHVLVKSALLIMLVFWQTKIHQNWKVEVHGHTCLSKSLCLGRFQRWGNMEQPWTKQACLSHTCVACVAAV